MAGRGNAQSWALSVSRVSRVHSITIDRLGRLRAWEVFAPLELVQDSEAGSWGCKSSLCCDGRKPIQRPKKKF